jgi:hypothetical protein
LTSVLGILGMAQHLVANRQHQRAMPTHQHRECFFAAASSEILQQVVIGSMLCDPWRD